jgi:hypothetical protein
MNKETTTGFTPDEKILAQLSEHSFLSLWTHPNLFRDQGKAAVTGDGKEIVDLAVILDETLILFSDKRCTDNGPFNLVQWKRFVRRTVVKSIEQLEGAERWFRESPDRIFLDRSCTQKLDTLSTVPFSRVFLVAICHGFEDDATDKLLNIDPSILDDWKATYNYKERCVGKYRTRDHFVHVFNGESLIVALGHFRLFAEISGWPKRNVKCRSQASRR